MTAFLFPGQGSQTPGMGRDFFEASADARAMFDQADCIEPGFSERVFTANADDLRDTRLQQVALFTVESAICAHLFARGVAASVCAGHSVGEFAALTAAGALDFADAFRTVRLRAAVMAEHAPEGAMTAVIGLPAEDIEEHLPAGAEVANYNGPSQTILSGALDAIAEAEPRLKKAGAKRVLRLPVSGPFHSSLMQPAADAFRQAISDLAIRAPKVRFVSSVSARDETEPGRIRDLLGRQISAPVRWTEVMKLIGPVPAVEVGPGRVLQGLSKRMDGAPQIEPAGTLAAADNLENAT